MIIISHGDYWHHDQRNEGKKSWSMIIGVTLERRSRRLLLNSWMEERRSRPGALFCLWGGVWAHICVFVCVCIHLAGVINIVAMSRCTLVKIKRMKVVEQSINNNNNENWIKLCVTQWKIQIYLELHLPPRDAQTCDVSEKIVWQGVGWLPVLASSHK